MTASVTMRHNAKLRIDKKYAWEHHRGGWSTVVDYLIKTCHHDNGTLFLTAIEDRLWYDGAVKEPWVGVMHQVPHQNYRFPDLTRLLETPQWIGSLPYCQGIFVLCDYAGRFLRERLTAIPISRLPYPQDTSVPRFSWDRYLAARRVVQIGEFLRNHQAFFDLNAKGHSKLLIATEWVRSQFIRDQVNQNPTVRVIDRISDTEYDELLTESVVFLNLLDAVAVTAIHECIVRATPVVVNRVGALPEFLGDEYPLFYSDLDEAEALLRDDNRIHSAHSYLMNHDYRQALTFEAFHDALEHTPIYRSLPSPAILSRDFETFDLSIVIVSYKRVDHIPVLLRALAKQDFEGKFEILLWNNNSDSITDIDSIVKSCPPNLVVRVLHSSKNYYCLSRFALSALARAPLMMFCDDDVLPRSHYVRHFLSGFQRHQVKYGERLAICARGHRFRPHRIQETIDDDMWQDRKVVDFFDENKQDVGVHFMHADNLLIPTALMRECGSIDMPYKEWGLIDDYWMSFVLAHHLGAMPMKIQADGVFEFTPDADNPSVALFHNPDVQHERIRFYLYHMRLGWPAFEHTGAEEQ